jgi:hypothetical protein
LDVSACLVVLKANDWRGIRLLVSNECSQVMIQYANHKAFASLLLRKLSVWFRPLPDLSASSFQS